jgi:hypothetical protein
MESIFKTPSEIKEFVINTLDESAGVNWEKVNEYTPDELQELLDEAVEKVGVFETAYKVLTDTQNFSLAPAIDTVMFELADAYAAVHTFSTVLNVSAVTN